MHRAYFKVVHNGLQIAAGQDYGRCPYLSATIYGRKDTDCKLLLPDLTAI